MDDAARSSHQPQKKPQWIRSFTSANDVSKQTYFALEQQMGRRMNGWLDWHGLVCARWNQWFRST